MLSESHPMYLQNLHINLIRARAKSNFTAFVLAIFTVKIVPPLVIIGTCTPYAYMTANQVMGFPIGMVSINVTVPHDNNGFRVFGAFFPLVEEIGEHVTAIESLVSNKDSPASTITANPPIESRWLPAPSVAEKVAPISFVAEDCL
jgi:hypothetical protein